MLFYQGDDLDADPTIQFGFSASQLMFTCGSESLLTPNVGDFYAWHHYCVTVYVDGVDPPIRSLFVDGVALQQNVQANWHCLGGSTSRIGHWTLDHDTYFQGLIDEFRSMMMRYLPVTLSR